jgi:hypothetical protein
MSQSASQILGFLIGLTEETLSIYPIDVLNPQCGWTAKLETIGPPTVAYGEDPVDALQQLIKRTHPNR